MNLNVSQLSGQLSGARLGPCRVCHDYTVLPAFGDDRCFGCTSDEIDEPEWVPEQQLLPREAEPAGPLDEIAAIFAEAQLCVTAARLAVGATTIRRGMGWSRGQRRRWRVTTAYQLRCAGIDRKEAAAIYYRGVRKAHRAGGVCLNCTRSPAPGGSMCAVCAAASRATYLTRKDIGVCVACKGPRDTGLVCEPCRVKRKAARKAIVAKYKAAGTCVLCFKRPGIGASCFCDPCKKKRNATRNRWQRARRSAAAT